MELNKSKPSRFPVRQRDKAALKESKDRAQTSQQARKFRTFRYLIYLQKCEDETSMRSESRSKDEVKTTGADSASDISDPFSGNQCQASNSPVDMSKAVHSHHFQKLPTVGE